MEQLINQDGSGWSEALGRQARVRKPCRSAHACCRVLLQTFQCQARHQVAGPGHMTHRFRAPGSKWAGLEAIFAVLQAGLDRPASVDASRAPYDASLRAERRPGPPCREQLVSVMPWLQGNVAIFVLKNEGGQDWRPLLLCCRAMYGTGLHSILKHSLLV